MGLAHGPAARALFKHPRPQIPVRVLAWVDLVVNPPTPYTPGQRIFPRGHGHLFDRKFVGVFVSLI